MVAYPEICTGPARLVLAPSLGGAIARLDVDDRPVLRPFQGNESDLFSVACNILVPFSNRMSGGGFEWDGHHHDVAPNFAGDPFPIHGDGFQRVWHYQAKGHRARMHLPQGTIGPWRYSAEQVFELARTSLSVALTVTNTGQDTLPFGVGFHPWFPRFADTRLRFGAEHVWLEDEQHLPTERVAVKTRPAWDFGTHHPLPDDWINNAFSGWRGPAEITQPAEAVSCMLRASPQLDTALVYSPHAQASFFCFEPVSHPVDAFHQPGQPGLQALRPGQQLHASMTLIWSDP